jgi:hypothetical protein
MRRQLPDPLEQRSLVATCTLPDVAPLLSPHSCHEPLQFSEPLLPEYEIEVKLSRNVSTVWEDALSARTTKVRLTNTSVTTEVPSRLINRALVTSLQGL